MARIFFTVLTLALATTIRAQLEASSVDGKYALQPGAFFSQATIAGNYAFLAGRAAEPNLSIDEGTTQVLTYLNETAFSLGATLDNAISARVFLNNIDDASAFNEIWSDAFTSSPPALTVAQAANPGGSVIEADAVLYLPNGVSSS